MEAAEYEKKHCAVAALWDAGKTAVGRRLSYYTHRRLVDMDQFIEYKAGRTVAEIFELEGEAGFRAREREAARLLAAMHGIIVSTGGGALTFSENVEAFRSEKGIIVLIDTSLKEIQRRLKDDTKRPAAPTAGPGGSHARSLRKKTAPIPCCG